MPARDSPAAAGVLEDLGNGGQDVGGAAVRWRWIGGGGFEFRGKRVDAQRDVRGFRLGGGLTDQ